jgi:predicted component of type VI protein secretion system
MARLTLIFKGKSLQVMPIEAGEIGIGRDPDNAMRIDSLAIAPHHAVIQCSDEGMLIRQLDQDYPLLVNNRKISEHRLNHGDRITVGKHLLYYADDDVIAKIRTDSPPQEPETAVETTGAKPAQHAPDASFQVLKGKHIGLVIPVRSALTRLGKDESGTAVIIRRSGGYFLSALAAAETVLVNNVPINDQSIRLNNGDIVKVNQHVLQFFC